VLVLEEVFLGAVLVVEELDVVEVVVVEEVVVVVSDEAFSAVNFSTAARKAGSSWKIAP
jgi:hypothetical protein